MPSTSEREANGTRERSGSSRRGPSRPQLTRIGSCVIQTRGVTSGAIRLIGYSPTAGFVITIVATQAEHAGVTAWKTSGIELREYERRNEQ